MGCGPSKHEVATGNTITRRLRRRGSSAEESKASFAKTDASTNDVKQVVAEEVIDGSDNAEKSFVSAFGSTGEGELVLKEEPSDELLVSSAEESKASSTTTDASTNDAKQVVAEEVVDGSENAEKSFVSAFGSADEGELVLKEEPSDELLVSGQETEGLTVVTESEAAENSASNEESKTNDAVEIVEENKEVETKENEESHTMEASIDDGESIGKHSIDFKETISVIDEVVEGEATVSENENKSSGQAEIVNEL